MPFPSSRLEPGDKAFIERLAQSLPDVRELLEEHLRDNDSQLLTYVFMGAYIWPWFLRYFRSPSQTERDAAIAYVELLEQELGSEDNDTRSLIQIEFVERLQNPDPSLDDVRKALPVRLRRSVGL